MVWKRRWYVKGGASLLHCDYSKAGLKIYSVLLVGTITVNKVQVCIQVKRLGD